MRLPALVASVILIVYPSTAALAQSARATSSDGKHSAVAAFDQGQAAQQRGDLNSAVRFYSAAITADPSLYQAFYQRATALLGLGREPEAESDF